MPCAQAATTKHMIEALGVPHTEVELILVNGESADFNRLLQDGDRVAVYPRFEAMDVTPLLRVRDASLARNPLRRRRPPRRAGPHAAHAGVRHAVRQPLRRRRHRGDWRARRPHRADARPRTAEAPRGDARLLCARAEIGAQLREIVERLDLARSARPFTLCLHCNAPLRPVDKASVLDRLPPRVREHYEHFSTCDVCGRVYWEGSHWRNMRRMLDGVMANNSASGT